MEQHSENRKYLNLDEINIYLRAQLTGEKVPDELKDGEFNPIFIEDDRRIEVRKIEDELIGKGYWWDDRKGYFQKPEIEGKAEAQEDAEKKASEILRRVGLSGDPR